MTEYVAYLFPYVGFVEVVFFYIPRFLPLGGLNKGDDC